MISPDAKLSPEEGFRESLKDAVVIVQRLASHYQSIAELAESLQLAVENDAHLRLVMSVVLQRKR